MPLVLIVDDNAGFRANARMLLESDGFEVAEAEDGATGVQRARELAPDFVLVDIVLPDIDGFEVSEQLSRLDHPPPVILISSRDGRDYRSLIAGSRAQGFIQKSELTPDAIRALLLVA